MTLHWQDWERAFWLWRAWRVTTDVEHLTTEATTVETTPEYLTSRVRSGGELPRLSCAVEGEEGAPPVTAVVECALRGMNPDVMAELLGLLGMGHCPRSVAPQPVGVLRPSLQAGALGQQGRGALESKPCVGDVRGRPAGRGKGGGGGEGWVGVVGRVLGVVATVLVVIMSLLLLHEPVCASLGGPVWVCSEPRAQPPMPGVWDAEGLGVTA
jgi:hypothetical protein